MSNEHVGYPRQTSEGNQDHDVQTEQERLLWRNNEVRRAAKDLLLNVEELPPSLPYRAKALEMINDILKIVPVLNSDDEARDERSRQELAERLKRAQQQWKNRNR